MEPPTAALMCGTARRAHRYWLVRLTSSVRRQSSGVISSIGPVGPAMPALLIRMSMPPSYSCASSNRRSIAASSATSAGIAGTWGSSPRKRSSAA